MDGRAVTRGVITRQASLGGMAVAEARHPPGFELPLHAHPIACATVVVEGTFEERVDGRTYRCREGDVLLKSPDAAHANRYWETGAVSFVLTFASRATSALSDEAGSLARVRLLRSAPAAGAMTRVRRATQRNEPDVSTEVDELALQLLRLASGGGEPAGIPGDAHARPRGAHPCGGPASEPCAPICSELLEKLDELAAPLDPS